MANLDYLVHSVPVAPLKICALPGCEDLAHTIDQYLVEFRRDLVAALSPSDVEGLTRRQFQAAFPGRAFTWRGPGVLSRNFALQQKRENR